MCRSNIHLEAFHSFPRCFTQSTGKHMSHTQKVTRMFIAASLSIAQNWKQCQCPPAGE